MIAKLVVWGPDRTTALAKLSRELATTMLKTHENKINKKGGKGKGRGEEHRKGRKREQMTERQMCTQEATATRCDSHDVFALGAGE
jgi:acetyl/propionyl-CoA carboxylase alpha subunit